jgi:hypothetical protein
MPRELLLFAGVPLDGVLPDMAVDNWLERRAGGPLDERRIA